MVIIPAIIGDLPYLESFRVANNKLINLLQDLSEKHNMIVIEPGSRRYSKPNHNTIEETEFFDILRDVKMDYNLDAKRLYLATTCSGANTVLKLAVNYPDRFAAVGFVAPEVKYSQGEINPWVAEQLPINYLKNIKNMPVFDIHSLIDRHVPVENSWLLNTKAEKAGLEKFKYVELPNEFPKYGPDDFYDNIFEFCGNYTLNTSPKEIDFTTSQMLYNKSFWITLNEISANEKASIQARIRGNRLRIKKKNIMAYTIDLQTLPHKKDKALKIIDNGQVVYHDTPKDSDVYIGPPKSGKMTKTSQINGPLAHIFAKKFMIVKGTLGNRQETKNINGVADTINKYWNKRYFVDCIIKNDIDITKEDMANSSLLLLGNHESNSILQRLQDSLPLKVSGEGVQLENEFITGNKLCYYMVYPNPLNKAQYMAVLGYNNPSHFSLGSENAQSFNDVSNYGWFDYKVWIAGEPPVADLFSGYFNRYWELQQNEEISR